MRASHLTLITFGVLLLALSTAETASAAQTNSSTRTKLSPWGVRRINDDETIKPLTFVHPTSRVIYYVESDGRHISAIAPAGKLLRHRNPFLDAKPQPYRYSKPVIRWIGLIPQTSDLSISFNSSQFGSLDAKTGDFIFLGQD